jgi:hypothetical protein
MNKMIFWAVCGAALFFGCSESPHTAGTTENESTIKWASLNDHPAQTADIPSFWLGKCLNDGLLKEAMPEAYLVRDSLGNDLVMVPRVNDYCEVKAELKYSRSGDTLTVSYDEIIMATKCVCYSDHWFDLPEEYKDAKYFRFDGVVYEIINTEKEDSL